jgi:hypothetical protein
MNITRVDASDCTKMTNAMSNTKIGFVNLGMCSNDWQIGGFLLQAALTDKSVGSFVLGNAGPCGQMCHFGICGMNIVGCSQAQGLIDKNKREASCNPPLQCAAFSDPCASVKCPDNSFCKPEERDLTPDFCCYVCPKTCAQHQCPPAPPCAKPMELRRGVGDNDPMGCCDHCIDVCRFDPCKGTEPTDEICGLLSDPDSKPLQLYREPTECCAKCRDPCVTEGCTNSTAPRTAADCPPGHLLAPVRGSCCRQCLHVCDRYNSTTGQLIPCPELTCSEEGTVPEIATRANAQTCCPTMCVAAAASRGAPEEIDWVLYGSIAGAAAFMCIVIGIILCVCLMRRKKKDDYVVEGNPMFNQGTMMAPMGVAAVPPLQPHGLQHHHGGHHGHHGGHHGHQQHQHHHGGAQHGFGSQHQGQSYYDAQSFYPDNGATGQFQTGQFQTGQFQTGQFQTGTFPSNDNFYGSQTSQMPPPRPPPTFSNNPYGDHNNAPPPMQWGGQNQPY